ncbi:MAG: hypothetical protein KAH07_10255 [Flavobacteriaceae bacterium]|nr:hypothetical protein [Flavobacteriaceae bacterium]
MEKQKSWFGRNWVWAVPGCGCLGIILFVVFGAGIAFFGIKNFMSNASPYDYAVEQATNSPQIIKILGDPVTSNGEMNGNVSAQNENGNAEFTVPLKGSKGYGILVVSAIRVEGEWFYEDLYVTIKDSQEQINLPIPD